MNQVSWDDSPYYGSLSPLTRYGTLNVSTARIPRKKRSRGNVPKPRTRCVGTALDDAGNAVLTDEGRATVKVTLADGTTEYRAVSSFRKDRKELSTRKATQTRAHVSRDIALMATIGSVYSPEDVG
jgi:hypothetical protein